MSASKAIVVAVAAILVASAVLAMAGWWLGAQAPGGGDTERIALGRGIYATQCASCHGAALEGQPNWRERLPSGRLPAPPHDETGHTWHHPDEQLFQLTKQGVAPFAPPGYETDMPGFAEALTDDEIRATLDFIKSTWPAEIRESQESITKRSQQ